MPIPIAVHIGGAFPGNHGGEMRRLQLRDVPLVDRVIGNTIEAHPAVRPRPRAGPFDRVIIVERLTRRENIEVAG